MLKTKSRDGVYIISAPDNAKTGLSEANGNQENYDPIQDVYFEVAEGKEGNLWNLAYAIAFDCFSMDWMGLHLLAKKLRCHVTAGDKKYEFTMLNYNCMSLYIESLAAQTKL